MKTPVSSTPPRRPSRIVLNEGAGPPPGYRWTVSVLHRAYQDAVSFLSEAQYQHLARLVKELALHADPTHSLTIDVRPVETYFEIRDKGGVLGRINVRVFYAVHAPSRTVVILGVLDKKNDGPTPLGFRETVRRRLRIFLEFRDDDP